MQGMEEYVINELLLSSTDSSTDDDVEIRGPMRLRPRVEGFVAMVVDEYDDNQFRENFRMNRATFQHILVLINERISTTPGDVGHHTLSAKCQLLVAIWYLATPDSYRSVCGRFNIGKATGLRTVRRVVNALCALSPTIIRWPTGATVNEVVEGFQQLGFPNTIGAIDGTHIQIPQPKEHGISYINRHNFSSILLQGVCDHNLCFIDCYAGEVGSTHDSRLLRCSQLWRKIIERPEETFPNNTHMIGDKAYPCLPHLLTPYKDNGHLTDAQKHFNYALSSARSTIERAFCLLKKRFRCLNYLDIICLDYAAKYVIACCVLHNICIMQNDLIEFPLGNDNQVDEAEGIMQDRERQLLGGIKRDQICQMLYNNI